MIPMKSLYSSLSYHFLLQIDELSGILLNGTCIVTSYDKHSVTKFQSDNIRVDQSIVITLILPLTCSKDFFLSVSEAIEDSESDSNSSSSDVTPRSSSLNT